MTEQQLCSEQEICEILGCDRSVLQEYVDESKLQVFIDGGKRKFRLQEIQDLLEELHQPRDDTDESKLEELENASSEKVDLFAEETFDAAGRTFDMAVGVTQRDRIVVLGRTRAGKTVFMTRLYEQLWESRDDFFIKALSGDVHRRFMKHAQDLSKGNWAPPTGDTTYADFELSDSMKTRLMVSIDYPGELFKRAFVDGDSGRDALELIDHVDRALAVILLLPPDINPEDELEERIVDTYGMQMVVEHIRKSPGGGQVPIAIAVTKGDQYKGQIRDCGGLRKFLVKHYLPLLRVIGRYRPFIIAAVQCNKYDSEGKPIPSFDLPPINLLDPIKWCWKKLEIAEEKAESQRRREIYLDQEHRILEEMNKHRRRAVYFWSIFWSLALIIGVVIVVATWYWMIPEK